MGQSDSKACSKCHEQKPLTAFSKSGLKWGSGLRNTCKTCASVARRAYYAANREKAIADSIAFYAANADKVKAAKAAYYKAHPEKQRAVTAKHYRLHQGKLKAKSAAWRAKNPEKARESLAAYRAQNKEEIRASKAAHRLANIEHVRSKLAAWRLANPESRRIHAQNRRARVRNAGGALSKGLAAKLFRLQKGKCPCCNLPLGGDFHLDHIVPLALGGENVDSNIQLLRAHCNAVKRSRHPVAFMRERGFLL